MPAPTTSTLNWLNEVKKADPDWEKTRLKPTVYEFSNGRTFTDKTDPYSTP